MDFSGVINWGPVFVKIVITDLEFDDEEKISTGNVVLNFNERTTTVDLRRAQ